MANYVIETFPQDKFSFRMYHNTGKKTWQEIQQETGCYGLINTAYFKLKTFELQSMTMIDGAWAKEGPYNDYGLCVDKDGYLSVDIAGNAVCDYTIGLPICYIRGKKYPTYKNHAKNGVSFVGTTASNDVVCLMSSKDDGMTTAEACKVMLEAGCVNILRYDGSWSSQGTLGPGKDVEPSEERKAAVYLLIYKKCTENDPKEEISMKKVVLDPGHGVETAGKCAPDRSYYEHEFNLDMAYRIKRHLERHGVEVTMTRTDEHDTGKTETEALEARVAISNKVRPDLFLSIHSNAYGDGGWTSPEGYGAYTSSAGESAGRNKAAKAILARVKEAGITLHGGGLHHALYWVLRNTIDPAVLIEHGFHTNKDEVELLKSDAYREKLAVADVKGVLDYLGIAWQEEPAPGAGMTQEQFDKLMDNWLKRKEQEDASEWSEAERKWAEENGIICGDGSGKKMYKAFATREHMVVFLYRLAEKLQQN